MSAAAPASEVCSDSSAPPSARSDSKRWLATIVLCLGQLMIVLDGTIINVALPSIQNELHLSQASLTWLVNAYMIAFGGFLLAAGGIGDLIGRKRVFLAGMSLFTVSSGLCGLAENGGILVAARFLQGVGAALGSAVIVAIIVTEFPGARERGKAIGIFSFTASAGGSIGLVAGGAITQALGWHWIFFVNVPIGVLTIWLGALLIEPGERRLRAGFDLVGSVLLTAGMMLLVYAIVGSDDYGWVSARTLVTAAAGAGLLGCFIASQFVVNHPIIPPRMMRVKALYAPNLVRALLFVGLGSQFFLGTLLLQRVAGYDALEAGLAYVPSAAMIAVLSVAVAPQLVRRLGARRTLLPGLLCAVAGLLWLGRVPVHADYIVDVLPAMVALGVGAGLSFMPTIMLAMSAAGPEDAGIASGMVSMSQQIPAAIGVAALGTIAARRTSELLIDGDGLRASLASGYRLGFVLAAAAVLLSALVALTTIRAE